MRKLRQIVRANQDFCGVIKRGAVYELVDCNGSTMTVIAPNLKKIKVPSHVFDEPENDA